MIFSAFFHSANCLTFFTLNQQPVDHLINSFVLIPVILLNKVWSEFLLLYCLESLYYKLATYRILPKTCHVPDHYHHLALDNTDSYNNYTIKVNIVVHILLIIKVNNCFKHFMPKGSMQRHLWYRYTHHTSPY